ncbi:DUF3025 domain-containing protein [Alteromonas oceanisediminis]|uniref:DUF3025 domain-containing protein n=1 Tax=Alteromonas oceanisediminis TaxID=2836180 RepID=UPI001BD93794|nr:DUF3025 domain-containing protein [Alteromonas oceanisediminis]MBT0584794.1 DUF3025 domain-containing protein [Alteromonas oceanisediminis]
MQTSHQSMQFSTQGHQSPQWGSFTHLAKGEPYLAYLHALYRLGVREQQPVVNVLEHLRQTACADSAAVPEFVCQSTYDRDQRYYESIIFEDNRVPTREGSWHDFFGGLIWLQFPHTKRLLNRLHVDEIRQHGLHPRTRLRNQITHFDECGLILCGTSPRARPVVEALAQHHWHSALWDNRACWHDDLIPIIFGHANLEMLMNPYLGLTAKWVYVELPSIDAAVVSSGHFGRLDNYLAHEANLAEQFEQRQRLKPLPLAGIPSWHSNQSAAFYANTEVFRRKR